MQDYFISAINQRVDTANVFTRWEYDPRDNWFKLSVSDSFSTRIGALAGKSGEYHVNPYFGHFPSFLSGDTDRIKAFNRLDWEYNKARTVTISHAKENIAGQPHYAFASWWCAQDAIELANLIMAFHKNGILNGYNIKYLIRMPQDYFDSQGGRSAEAKDTKKRWGDFSDNLSKWLAGTDNVNKSMLIKYLRGTDGKMLDNVYAPLVGRNSRFFADLIKFVNRAETQYIVPVITRPVFRNLKTRWQDADTLLTEIERELIEKIRFAAFLTLHEAYPYLPLLVDNEGVRQIRKKDGIREEDVGEKPYRQAQRRQLWQDAQLYLSQLTEFMDEVASPTIFPEYYESKIALSSCDQTEDYTHKPHVVI